MKKRGLILSILSLTFVSLCASCSLSNDNGNGTTSDLVDYVEQVKLNLEYKGHDFLTEGIGEVTLMNSVDGDTAHFIIDGKDTKVRFLAIDTPESVKENNIVEPFGKEASEYTCKALSDANKITIEYDKDKEDHYGRILAWVFVDGYLLQEELVRNGLADIKYMEDYFKYKDVLEKAQQEAIDNKVGIWSYK